MGFLKNAPIHNIHSSDTVSGAQSRDNSLDGDMADHGQE
jgi:hypothetical protein